MDKTLSQAFDLLRFPLAVLVVFLHIDNAPSIAVLHYDWSWNDGRWLYELTIVAVNIVAKIAVPCFFFISGYLFFYKNKIFTVEAYKDKIKRRIRSLLIPYVIWNILAVAYLYVTQDIVPDSLAGIFIAPANFPLWFLRDLIIIVVFSPIIYGIVRYAKLVGLLAMTVLYVSNLIPVLVVCLFSSVYFFYLGSYCSQNGFVELVRRDGRPLYIATGALLAASFVLYGQGVYDYVLAIFLIVGTLCSIKIGYELVENGAKLLPVLTASSFFIYVSHKLGATYIAKLLFKAMLDNYYVLTLRFFVAPFLAVLICIAVFAVWQKCSPKTLSFVTGRK